MKYVLLPGFSISNKEWAYKLQEYFSNNGINLEVVEWRHWKGQNQSFSLKQESQKVRDIVGDEEVVILAKSVGTRLSAYLIKNNLIKISKIILMGVPSENEIYIQAFSQFPGRRVAVVQNTSDPMGSYVKVKNFFHKINPEIKVLETPRRDHIYPYPEMLQSLIKV